MIDYNTTVLTIQVKQNENNCELQYDATNNDVNSTITNTVFCGEYTFGDCYQKLIDNLYDQQLSLQHQIVWLQKRQRELINKVGDTQNVIIQGGYNNYSITGH